MEVNSYLIPELTTGTGTQPGVVVIDEPQGFGNVPLLTRQSSTTRGWPIWFITINNAPLHSTLRAAAPGAVLFTNPRGNAFEVVPFRQAVRNAGVRRLVVTGHETNMCVKLSVMGGKWKPDDPSPTLGAIGYGYEVLTCQGLLSGGAADWKSAASLISSTKG